jgi:hypothetical protein
MSEDVTTSFVTYYIRSLAERTRVEKTTTKFGFDWIVYNLALAEDLVPYRLPFFRAGPAEISKTKTEAEFGIDSSFLSRDRKTLTIFVLKDEELSNATWTANDFDSDLRRAAAPDLSPPEFKAVREVRIVLVYNKDEDRNGIQLFENLTKSLGTKIGDNVQLSFERWNLTVLSDKVKQKLLTPSLLPQKFFSLFSYTCSQFADFRHGSDEWSKQLIPNWRRFLEDLLKEQADERTIRLLPVVLLILREYGRSNPTAETGWIDLAEWAMLAAWRVHQTTDKNPVKEAIIHIWVGFYLTELERYYAAHNEELATEHSLEIPRTGNYLDAIAAALTAFWHIGRLGILAVTFAEILPRNTEVEKRVRAEAMHRVSNWLVGLINANPGAQRPLIDLHHLELFLVWRILWQIGRRDDIEKWFHGLESNLFVRRAGAIPLPFIEGGNSIELVFEHVATGEKPPEFCDQSSLLLLCLLELAFALEPTKRNEVIAKYYQQLVLGRTGEGEQLKNCQPLDLIGWVPPNDWGDKVLTKSLRDEGESQTLETFDKKPQADGEAIAARLQEFIQQSRKAQKTNFPTGLPVAVIILACLKFRSPLPPEIWRLSLFGPVADEPKKA